ncbi:TVP38/TMEM64 family protein [uncultured Limosilactobacillus sp.]|uniref:TVP38/TMEM64 family protein n=1 Tax=uncultured Limosilactobacillus sp. TaxID=2837629 RepID=UPI0025FE44C9|nr:VTT domain-containing protein [uncultured Limosilactobacillus sp.]
MKENQDRPRPHYVSKTLLISLAVIIIVVALIGIYHDFKPELNLILHYNHRYQGQLLHLIRAHSYRDMGMLIVIIAMMNAIPGMSNSVVCIFAGVCYGPIAGLLINWIGNITGNCLVAGLITHIHFSERFKHSKSLKHLTNTKHPLITLTIGYMIPIIPSALVNYAVVQMGVSRKRFLAMVIIGMLPTSYLYAFGGDAIIKGDLKRIIIALVIIIGAIAIYKLIEYLHTRKEKIATN